MTLLATAESGDSLMGSDGIALATTNVRQWLVASHHSKQLALLDKFEMELRLGKLFSDALQNPTDKSSHRDRRYATFRTVELLQNLVGSTRWKHPAQLMALLRGVGRELHAAGGFREPAIGNVIRRVMAAVREEVNLVDTSGEIAVADTNVMENSSFTTTPRSDTAGRLSLQSVLWALPQHVKAANRSFHRSASGRQHQRHESLASESEILEPSYATEYSYPANYYTSRPDLKQSIMEAIQEIMSDLEDLHKNINEQATNHIHSGEVILTYGRSKTVELFLKAAAAKKLKFQVIVCEGAPTFDGHEMAKTLADAGIDTIVIADSAAFALMARVNKVLLPAHSVLANGGLITASGCNLVALAADYNTVPVVCITGMFKLCPMYPHEGQDTLNDMVSPSTLIDYSEMSDDLMSNVEVINNIRDYIAPKLVSLYVTNVGSFPPSYIYRLLAEYYHSDDWDSLE